jgi:2-isopropylmalate synthase
MSKDILIYDTTLHDSPDWPAPPLSALVRKNIAQMLYSLGVDYLEVSLFAAETGSPSGPQELLGLPLKHARFAASAPLPFDLERLEQRGWIDPYLAYETPAATLVVRGLNSPLAKEPQAWARYFDSISEGIRALKGGGKEVFLELEDFFTGYKREMEFTNRHLETAGTAGVDRVILNETTGATLPWEAGKTVHDLFRKYPQLKFGIHFHDAGHSAVAGALTAVDQGAVHVQGSINGFGSRSGEANLCNIIPDLELVMGYACLPEGNLPGLLDVAHYLKGTSADSAERTMRYVGRSEMKPI